MTEKNSMIVLSDAAGSDPVKKSYTTPRLIVYGNLASITHANPTGGKNDHTGGSVKTS
jgi:hypothetical protein